MSELGFSATFQGPRTEGRQDNMEQYLTLIDSTTLLKALDSVKIFDCRASLADPQAGRRAFLENHIPGAQYLSLDEDLAAAPGAGGRHPLPEPEALAARLRTLGANNADQLVVYDDAGGAFAARAWWCLRWLGHQAVAVLDGGLNNWRGSLTDALETATPGNFDLRSALTRTIDVNTLATSAVDYTLIDARSQPRFEGREEPIDPIAGHIPGALCRPFQDNLDEAGKFKDPPALAARFPAEGDSVVCYCGSGVTAAHNILAMRVAGISEPLLYPGSWSEWIRSEDRPRAP